MELPPFLSNSSDSLDDHSSSATNSPAANRQEPYGRRWSQTANGSQRSKKQQIVHGRVLDGKIQIRRPRQAAVNSHASARQEQQQQQLQQQQQQQQQHHQKEHNEQQQKQQHYVVSQMLNEQNFSELASEEQQQQQQQLHHHQQQQQQQADPRIQLRQPMNAPIFQEAYETQRIRIPAHAGQIIQFPVSYHPLTQNSGLATTVDDGSGLKGKYILLNGSPLTQLTPIHSQLILQNSDLSNQNLQNLHPQNLHVQNQLNVDSDYTTLKSAALSSADDPSSVMGLPQAMNCCVSAEHLTQQAQRREEMRSMAESQTPPALSVNYQSVQSPSQQQNGGPSDNNNYTLQQQKQHSQQQQDHDPQTCESPTISVDDDMPNTVGGSGMGQNVCGIGHTARTPPETLEWLRNNYEPYEGASLPRCTLYDHYLSHCSESSLDPVNAASFGKLIRSVFKGLRTRRLGTRGNSKYHYNGIRIKESSVLLRAVSDDEFSRANCANGAASGGGGAVHSGMRTAFRRRSSTAYQAAQTRSSNTPPTVSSTSSSLYHLRSRDAQQCADSTNSTNGNQYGDPSGAVAGNDSITAGDYTANSDTFEFERVAVPPLHGGTRSASINSSASSSAGGGGHARPNARGGAAAGAADHTQDALSATSASGGDASRRFTPQAATSGGGSASLPEIAIALGSGQVPRVPMPNLEELEECLLPFGYTIPHVLKFIDAYSANCSKVLDAIKHLRFESVEGIWTSFWQSPDAAGDQMNNADGKMAESTTISFDQLLIYRLCSLSQIQKYMETMDTALYQVLIEMLIPDVLRTTLTPRLSCQIRNFAKNMEQWLKKAMGNAPADAKKAKLAAVRLLANALTRYTSFNHLADAARAVLRNKEQVTQMYNDFCKVDFAIVRGQADWVCNCDPTLVSSIESEFKENLRQQRNLDEWTEWMEAVVDQVLAKYHDKPLTVQMDASKQFLLKWSFYSSMILRDVTYRSAQSFGSFHLIRLLYDEYMCLLVEMRLAKATNQPTICVMRTNNWLQSIQYQQQAHQQQQQQQQQHQHQSHYGMQHVDLMHDEVVGAPLGVYYHTVPLTPTHHHQFQHQQHHLPPPHPNHDIIVSTPTSLVPNATMLSRYDSDANAVGGRAQNTQQIMTDASMYATIGGGGGDYQLHHQLQPHPHQLHQSQQQQMLITSNIIQPGGSTLSSAPSQASSAIHHYAMTPTSVATPSSTTTPNPMASATRTISSSSAMPLSSTFATSSMSLLDASGGGGAANGLGDILVHDPTLSSVDYAHAVDAAQRQRQRQQQLGSRAASFDDGSGGNGGGGAGDGSAYIVLNLNHSTHPGATHHHLRLASAADQQARQDRLDDDGGDGGGGGGEVAASFLMGDEHDYATMTALNPMMTSAASIAMTPSSANGGGGAAPPPVGLNSYHRHAGHQHHQMGAIVYMEEEEDADMMDASDHHVHHHHHHHQHHHHQSLLDADEHMFGTEEQTEEELERDAQNDAKFSPPAPCEEACAEGGGATPQAAKDANKMTSGEGSPTYARQSFEGNNAAGSFAGQRRRPSAENDAPNSPVRKISG